MNGIQEAKDENFFEAIEIIIYAPITLYTLLYLSPKRYMGIPSFGLSINKLYLSNNKPINHIGLNGFFNTRMDGWMDVGMSPIVLLWDLGL